MVSAAERPDVIIVGGGLAGLSTGIALAGAGIDTVILEARRKSSADVFGFLLWPPGTRCLRWLGVLDEALKAGQELESLTWFLTGRKQTWLSVDLNSLGAGTFLGILPSRLEAILREAAKRSGVRILDAVESWSVSRERGSWTVRAQREDGPVELTTPLLVGADGAGSRLREELGLASSRWQPSGQVIVTGVGGALPVRESRQALTPEGSGGCVSIGQEHSWLYAVTPESGAADPTETLRHYTSLDPEPAEAYRNVERVAVLRPWTITVPRWATDGAVLMGDAAHGMLPHFGLGGSLTLEDVPLLLEVVEEALREGDFRAARLAAFQARRRARVAYAQRTSNSWARVLGTSLPGMQRARDLSMRRLTHDRELVESFYRELASPSVPRLSTRLRMLLP
ncbi:hypothetical protein GCM10027168_16510 [Streptomyces capparidis]